MKTSWRPPSSAMTAQRGIRARPGRGSPRGETTISPVPTSTSIGRSGSGPAASRAVSRKRGMGPADAGLAEGQLRVPRHLRQAPGEERRRRRSARCRRRRHRRRAPPAGARHPPLAEADAAGDRGQRHRRSAASPPRGAAPTSAPRGSRREVLPLDQRPQSRCSRPSNARRGSAAPAGPAPPTSAISAATSR